MYIVKSNKTIRVKMCSNLFNRFLGLMFKKNFNYSLCFPKCNSIHTFFMLENIDVIMTDKNYNILYIFNNIKPNRIILPKKNVHYTFELPTNTIKFNINEKITIEKKV